MFQGKMTYLGIAQLAIAYLLKDYASAEEVNAAVSNLVSFVSTVLALAGFVQAVYGRWRIQRARYTVGQ